MINSDKKPHIFIVIETILLLAFTLLILVPFIWMILMSLRTTDSILQNPYGLPTRIHLQNYSQLFLNKSINFQRYIFNSAIVTICAIALTIFLTSLGGYGFGRPRFAFKGRETLFSILLLALMLPRQAMYIPQFILMNRYRLLNTRLSLIFLYAAYAVSVSTFLFKTYFSQLPQELEDSARIDGATDLSIFYRIMLPLTKPVLSTVILINFLRFWNELLIAMTMVTKPQLRTLPLAMMHFVGENGSDYAMAAASLVVGMLPILILYLFLSERFIEGVTAGALKG